MRPSPPLTTFFMAAVLSVLLAAAHLGATAFARSSPTWLRTFFVAAAVLVAYCGVLYSIAGTGALADFDSLPPSIGRLLIPIIVANVLISCVSSIGAKLATLPARTLVAFQAFRFLPEAFLHLGYREGSLPAQMTWPPEGRNVDVLIAALALGLALPPRPLPRAAVWAFALLGLLSLLNVAYTSVRSLAHRIRPASFEPGLEMAAYPPYILLPGLLVQLALCGQLVLLRKLVTTRPGIDDASPAGAGDEDVRSMW